MGMAVGGDSGGLVADINVTPMVDVMLVLLIIFMVVAPLLQSGVSVSLPKSKNPDADAEIIKETSAVIAITDKNEVYLNKDRLPKEDLAPRLKEALEAKFKDKREDQKVVYVKSDQGVQYGTVVSVIDAIREAGYDRIGLVSEKEKEKGGAAAAPAK
ncbi:MAG TPA: biopolymer transporter ExbD [Blastocatellia bacterium]|nr:biopolymer transporter ExbD [Blastocatellia bacterium]